MIWLVLIGLFILSIVCLKRAGLLDKVVINPGQLPHQLFLFKEYTGQYRNIGSAFAFIGANMAPSFKDSRCAGIYYDNPANIIDPSKCRACIGILIDPSQKSEAEAFINEKTDQPYRMAMLSECQMYGTTIPIKGMLTYMTLAHRVYTPLFRYTNERIPKGEKIYGSLEIYKADGREPTEMEVCVPVGGNAKAYYLTEQPEPEYLNVKKQQ